MVVEGNLDKNVENSQVPEVEPVPLTVEAQSPNHWTAREFPPSFSSWSELGKDNLEQRVQRPSHIPSHPSQEM